MALLLVRCTSCGQPFTVPEEETAGLKIGSADFRCVTCTAKAAATPTNLVTYTVAVEFTRTEDDGEVIVLGRTSFSVDAVSFKDAVDLLGQGLSVRWDRLAEHAGLAEIETVE